MVVNNKLRSVPLISWRENSEHLLRCHSILLQHHQFVVGIAQADGQGACNGSDQRERQLLVLLGELVKLLA